MVVLESSDFDPDKSPVNFYYARVKDSDGNVINFQIYVYGERGQIWRYQHANRFAPQ